MTCSAQGLHERAAAAGTQPSSQCARHSQLRPSATSLVDESDASDAFLLSNWRTSVATPGAVSKEPLALLPAPPAALPRRARVREQPGLTRGVAGLMPASATKKTKK
jgi:hypothetical protein